MGMGSPEHSSRLHSVSLLSFNFNIMKKYCILKFSVYILINNTWLFEGKKRSGCLPTQLR